MVELTHAGEGAAGQFPRYWLYRTRINMHYNREVVAKVVTPPTHKPSRYDCGFGFPSPLQDEPYGVPLALTLCINPKHKHPDNYLVDRAFQLFSERLIELMRQYEVKFESFPATLVDAAGNPQDRLRYHVFHSLEGEQDAMDHERSGWRGAWELGVPRLVLDYSKFEHRPLFTCALIHTPLMRDDLKQAIRCAGLTGFEFLAPYKFQSGLGQFSTPRFPPPYDD